MSNLGFTFCQQKSEAAEPGKSGFYLQEDNYAMLASFQTEEQDKYENTQKTSAFLDDDCEVNMEDSDHDLSPKITRSENGSKTSES